MARVSIGLPVYNGEKYLEEAIEAFLKQTYRDFELILSDNASTDRTEEICRRYASADGRIRYFRQERNTGGGPNANFTIEQATGEFYKLASYDDICASTFLEKCVEALDADPGLVLAFARSVDIDVTGQRVQLPYNARVTMGVRAASPKVHQRFRNMIRTDYGNEEIFGVIRMQALRKAGVFKNYTDCDRVLLAQLALQGRMYEVPEELFFHRIHSQSSSYAVLPGVAPLSLRESHRHWRDITYWYKPEMAGQEVFPISWQLRDYVKMILECPMALGERVRCAGALFPFLARKFPFLGIEFIDWVTNRKPPSRTRGQESSGIHQSDGPVALQEAQEVGHDGGVLKSR